MPLLFKQQRRPHYPPTNYGHVPKPPSSSTINNNEFDGGHNSSLVFGQTRFNLASSDNCIQQGAKQFSKIIHNPKLLLPWLKVCYQKWHLKHLIPLVFVMLYMFIGAIIFLWLEESVENKRISKRNYKIKREKSLFLKRINEICFDQAAIQKMPLRRKFVDEALKHFHRQLKIDLYYDVNYFEWSLTTAMYYSGTIFTTIGYGDVSCSTTGGRIATVIYAIIGIPIMLITLNHLGKFLYKWINDIVALYTFIEQRITSIFFSLKNKRKSSAANKSILSNSSTINCQPICESNLIVCSNDYLTNKEKFVDTKEGELQRRVSFALHNDDEDDDLPLNMHAVNDPDINKTNFSISPPSSAVSIRLKQKAHDLAESLDKLKDENADLELGNLDNVTNSIIDDIDNANMQEDSNLPRMPVIVALTCTLSWIFICAGLFKLWENEWTYAESCYFMFISLSTIGLGDVNVKRRDLMVVCFIFVIIGLSLVSMCINVIQLALEDFYKTFLMKILLDYQVKLAQGGNAHSASMGMMKMWGNSKTAKFLMPILSADTKRAVMQKVQKDAKETGIIIPPIFENIDDKTGMPKILAAADKSIDFENQSAIVNDLVKQSEAISLLQSLSPVTVTNDYLVLPAPKTYFYENYTQTNQIFINEKTTETIFVEYNNATIQTSDESKILVCPIAIQTEKDEKNNIETMNEGVQTVSCSDLYNEKKTQTDHIIYAENETLTEGKDSIETSNTETMTLITSLISLDVQTEQILKADEQIQTQLVDQNAAEIQTEPPETIGEPVQTLPLNFIENEAQTDNLQNPKKSKKFFKNRRVRGQLQHSFSSNASYDDHQSKSNWNSSMKDQKNDNDSESDHLSKVENEELLSSYESLNWDPIDGMHAEKQRPVKDLKKMFDRASFKQSSRHGAKSSLGNLSPFDNSQHFSRKNSKRSLGSFKKT